MTIEFTPDDPPVEGAVLPYDAAAEVGHLADRFANALLTLCDVLFDLAHDLWDDYGIAQEEEEGE